MSYSQTLYFDVRKMGHELGMCEQNCRLGFGIKNGHFHSAKLDMEYQKAHGTLHTSAIPTNVAVPVYLDTPSPYEHVVVSDHGIYYSDGRRLTSLSGFKIFGWGECMDNVRVVKYVEEPAPTPAPVGSFLPAKGYWGYGDTDARVGRLASFMRKNYPAYTSVAALGNFFGGNIKYSITEFQKRTGLQADGNVGPITYAKLQSVGFKG